MNAGGTAAEVKKGRFLLVVPVVSQSHESPRVTGGPFQLGPALALALSSMAIPRVWAMRTLTRSRTQGIPREAA